MLEKERVIQLEERIKRMKIELNNLTEKGLNGNEIVELSQNLDLLINEYYGFEFKN